MSKHVVRQGETIASIAKRHSLADWRTIYDHPENATFRQKRPNPNLIYPGDVILVPDRELRDHPGSTGKRHVFVYRRPEQWIRLIVLDHEAKPLANTPYELKVGSRRYTGTTGENGLVETEIEIDASSGRLKAGDHVFNLAIGHLNPMDKPTPDHGVSGAQGRLHNLGYPVGPADGLMGPKTRAAIRYFQADECLPATGDLDVATQAKLIEVHGV